MEQSELWEALDGFGAVVGPLPLLEKAEVKVDKDLLWHEVKLGVKL